MPVGLVTGASRGLGLALARALNARGWEAIVDARDATFLHAAVDGLPAPDRVTAVAGDVSDPDHRDRLAAEIRRLGRLDLLVNNASELGPSPLPSLAGHPLDELERIYSVNVIAPLAIIQLVLPELRAAEGMVVNISSDAAVEAYERWGGYGSSKAALDRLSAVLAAEERSLTVYSFDPGDMRTDMHQRAFPDEDISDRAEPETVIPALLRLVDERPSPGRYSAAELAAAQIA
jgi:NAD(P)-dependent dehydrogenase (short-subunit alcohol dehydrogenase family)